MPSLNTSLMANIPLYLPKKSNKKSPTSPYRLRFQNRTQQPHQCELEAMAKNSLRSWFVQFDFPFDFTQGKPDKNGRRTEPAEVKPYKSSGGIMVWNEELKGKVRRGGQKALC